MSAVIAAADSQGSSASGSTTGTSGSSSGKYIDNDIHGLILRSCGVLRRSPSGKTRFSS
jgi:hypothetical protein